MDLFGRNNFLNSKSFYSTSVAVGCDLKVMKLRTIQKAFFSSTTDNISADIFKCGECVNSCVTKIISLIATS